MNDPRGVGITRLGQVAIPVHDVGRATTFYGDVLGLRFLFQAGQLAFFDCGAVRLMLDRPEKPEFDPLLRRSRYAGGAWTPGRCRRCGRRGAPPEPMPDHNLWMGFFRDTEGSVMALLSEVPRKPCRKACVRSSLAESFSAGEGNRRPCGQTRGLVRAAARGRACRQPQRRWQIPVPAQPRTARSPG